MIFPGKGAVIRETIPFADMGKGQLKRASPEAARADPAKVEPLQSPRRAGGFT